jgi:hypothetical protein
MRSARWDLDVETLLRSGVAEVRGYDVKVRILGEVKSDALAGPRRYGE